MALGVDARRGARLDPTGLYRYWLSRRWGDRDQYALFIMLNPSTADAREDDATIRRCTGFARSWGYDGLGVVNLYALRSPNPDDVREHAAPIGDENDAEIARRVKEAGIVIAAWGAFPWAQPRAQAVLQTIGKNKPVHALGTTKGGFPRHPLYVKSTARPEVFGSTRPDEVYTHFGLD